MNFEATAYTLSERSCPVRVREDTRAGVRLVYVSASADEALSPDNAIVLRIAAEVPEALTALERHSEYWCRPVFCEDESGVPDETQLLLIKAGGRYTVILPVVSEQYRTVLAGGRDGLRARVFSLCDGLTECSAPVLAVAEGDDPAALTEQCFRAALSAMGAPVRLREERMYPEVLEYLGWCSWDALQIRVSEAGLLEKAAEFRDKNIPVHWALIDDMWADIPMFRTETYATRAEMFALMHRSRLASFEAAPERFPHGLKGAIRALKEYIPAVGVWHPTTGYWFGIDENSALFAAYRDDLFATADGRQIVRPAYESFSRFFGDWHAFMRDSGADFVKVDNQSILRMFYRNLAPIGEIARAMHRAIDDSVRRHFGGAVINCMGCASDNVFSRPESAVTRCSDDFIPDDADWFTKHILQCSFTCMYQSALYWSDWDMWWTDDGQAVKNSLLRAVSGGPIYVSDETGRSRADVLAPLTLSDGRILRCSYPAAPTTDSMFGDPTAAGRLFKIRNFAGKSGIVAVFNLGGAAASGTVSLADVPGISGERFAVYEHFSGEKTLLGRQDSLPVTLPDKTACALYILTPIEDDFAAIGITQKFISPLTVQSASRSGAVLLATGTYLYYKDGAFYEEERTGCVPSAAATP